MAHESTTTPDSELSGRVRALDGLRAFAILPVLVTHFWPLPPGYELLNRLARSGWIGVDLFFVLSGFLITGILWEDRRSPGYYGNFYARRALRIFPLYYLLLLLVFVGLANWHPTPGLITVRGDWPLYAGYLANLALLLHGWHVFPLDITWSLAVEEQFYLCWPWGIRRLRRRTLLVALGLIVVTAPVLRTIALVAFHASWMATHMLTVFRLDGFAAGALLAIILKEQLAPLERLRRWARWSVPTLGALLLGLILAGRFERSSLLVGTVGYSLLSLFFAGLLVCALTEGRLTRVVFESSALCRIGLVSYGMYILHPLTWMMLDTATTRLGLQLRALTSSPLASSVIALLVTAACTYGVAEVSYRWFERPLLRLKHRFRAARPRAPQAHTRELAPAAGEPA